MGGIPQNRRKGHHTKLHFSRAFRAISDHPILWRPYIASRFPSMHFFSPIHKNGGHPIPANTICGKNHTPPCHYSANVKTRLNGHFLLFFSIHLCCPGTLAIRKIMQRLAFVLCLLAAFGSLALVIIAGRHSPPLLTILFAGWVISPFIALFLVRSIGTFRPIMADSIFSCMIFLISIGSLTAYIVALVHSTVKPATQVYLIVPLCSWILIVIAVTTKAIQRRSQKNT